MGVGGCVDLDNECVGVQGTGHTTIGMIGMVSCDTHKRISETDRRIMVLNTLSGNTVPYRRRTNNMYCERYSKDVVVLLWLH